MVTPHHQKVHPSLTRFPERTAQKRVPDDTTTPGSSGDEIWILDAANLSQGPIARLTPDMHAAQFLVEYRRNAGLLPLKSDGADSWVQNEYSPGALIRRVDGRICLLSLVEEEATSVYFSCEAPASR